MDNVTQRLFVPTAEGQEVRSYLSYRAKRELLLQMAPRYREASSALKEVILDEFVAATGYARKYAIRLLNHPADLKLTIERPRPPHYGPEVQQALHLTWTAANHICVQRLLIGCCVPTGNKVRAGSRPPGRERYSKNRSQSAPSKIGMKPNQASWKQI